MSKILLVIRREYATRVRKPSFWLLTILVPIMLAALYAIPIILATRPVEKSVVLVADESGLFGGLDRDDTLRADSRFNATGNISYRYCASLEHAKREMASSDEACAILYVSRRASGAIPTDACLYYKGDMPPQQVRGDVDRQLQVILRNRLLQAHGISGDEYALITGTRIKLRSEDMETGRAAFVEVKTVLGCVLAMLIYFVIFIFGAQVMRGVVEEKSSRIIEVIVCSVKPFQLMMGKVVGIALVGLTQLLLWVALTGVALVGIQGSNSELFRLAGEKHDISELATKGTEAGLQMQQADELANVPQLVEGISSIDFSVIVPAFLLYFVFGYLLYSTLFAAAGALGDSDTDTQIVSLPLTVPLLATILCMPAMIEAPSGTLGVVLSMIPFTSPVAMMLRLPFGVPLVQLWWSLALLVLSFPLCTWFAARIYRGSILRYGILTGKKRLK